ncbi:MAG: CheB methylesterase domain-containing protein [Gammaproteobacteria bacterium]|nr:CheB methylesterase domain-containing protein [Gammaproteobacteria bacterium]
MYKALIVHASAICRNELNKLVVAQPSLSVQAAVQDVVQAHHYIDHSMPDLVLLQIDGNTEQSLILLEQLLQSHNNIILVYTKLPKCDSILQEAIKLGIRDFIAVPEGECHEFISTQREQLGTMLADMVKMIEKRHGHLRDALSNSKKLIVLGTSMGGPGATEAVLSKLPISIAGMVIVQHIRGFMLDAYVKRLDDCGSLRVKLAEDQESIQAGKVLIAPADFHTLIKHTHNGYVVKLQKGPPIGRHLPAVDALFNSTAQSAGADALGIIMTGMGEDGALAIARMRKQGALTIAQDEKTSAIFGMPKAAIIYGGIDYVLPLDEIPAAIVKYASIKSK